MGNDNPTVDQVTIEEGDKASPLEENLKSRRTWMRFVFMVAFYLLVSLASIVGTAVVILGFLWVLFTGETNRSLQQAGQGIAAYLYEIVRYLTYNSDARPFPFGGEWPSASADDPARTADSD